MRKKMMKCISYNKIHLNLFSVVAEQANSKKSMKEVEESAGLLEDFSEDEEIKLINGFDPDIPLTLQAAQHVKGMQLENEKRKKYRDPETCCTPPLAEDSLWSNLNDDPFGVYTDLGGRSSPTTPPPLRALKLTCHQTADKILKAISDVKEEAFKVESTKEVDLVEDLASHDSAIKKFKNFKTSNKIDPSWFPGAKKDQMPRFRGRPKLSSSLIMRPTMERACTPKCPGSFGILPSLQCASCKAMFHAKCQGLISPNLRVFRCRRCLASMNSPSGRGPGRPRGVTNQSSDANSSSVKLKLPMVPKNGKRPIVELVLRTPEGRYQPIKFRNNSQITETIPRALFHKVCFQLV